jgi:hypothetical protein
MMVKIRVIIINNPGALTVELWTDDEPSEMIAEVMVK